MAWADLQSASPLFPHQGAAVPKRPDHIQLTIVGCAARPSDVRKLTAAARHERASLTRQLNGTAGRARSFRRQLRKEERDLDAAEIQARKVAAALRRQRRAEQRAWRDEDFFVQQAHREMQRTVRALRGASGPGLPSIFATSRAHGLAPEGWMPMLPGASVDQPRGGGWKRAEDGLRSVQLNVSAVSTGGTGKPRQGPQGRKERNWRAGDAVDNLIYCGRGERDGIRTGDLISNMFTGQVQAINSRDEFEHVLACADVAEHVEAQATTKGRRHTIFKKLILPLPAELDAAAHHRIMYRLADHFQQHGVPFALARHTPDEHDNPNIHLHGQVHVRRFAMVGDRQWEFTPDLATEVLSKAAIAEVRKLLADLFNEELVQADLAPDFTHLSRLARGLSPVAERHQGKPKAGKKAAKAHGLGPTAAPPETQIAATPDAEASIVDEPAASAPAPAPAPENATSIPLADRKGQSDPNSVGMGGVATNRETVHYAPAIPKAPRRTFSPSPTPRLPIAAISNLPAVPLQITQAPLVTTGLEPEVDRSKPGTDAQSPSNEPFINLPSKAGERNETGNATAVSLPAEFALDLSSRIRAAAVSVWERTPARRAIRAQEAEAEQKRAVEVELEAERKAAEDERQRADQIASRNAYWRAQLLQILERNHLIHAYEAQELNNPHIYDRLDDRRFIQQTMARTDLTEADREGFFQAFRLAKRDFNAAFKLDPEERTAVVSQLQQSPASEPVSPNKPIAADWQQRPVPATAHEQADRPRPHRNPVVPETTPRPRTGGSGIGD
jgi:hypothetical protein